MQRERNTSFKGESKRSRILSRNANIIEILQLCSQPDTKNEMENILLNFWTKFEECVSNSEDFCEFDVVCMYVLDYVYEHDSASLSAMLRSLYAYQKQIQVTLKQNNRNLMFNKSFLTELRRFTNVHPYSKRDKMFEDVEFNSLENANLGLVLFLVKFGLVEFPSEVNEEGREMVESLVLGFNGFSDVKDDLKTSVQPDEVLNRMRHSDISFRRSLFIFCTIVIVAELGIREKGEIEFNFDPMMQHLKLMCFRKLACLGLFISTTTEPKITSKDIEHFLATIINPLINTEVSKRLMETSQKIFCELEKYCDPRSLKELARCKIRACLRSSKTLPEQVNQLEISVDLKKFLLFHYEGIWNLLKENHVFHLFTKAIESL